MPQIAIIFQILIFLEDFLMFHPPWERECWSVSAGECLYRQKSDFYQYDTSLKEGYD
jgi:hypothetical protein